MSGEKPTPTPDAFASLRNFKPKERVENEGVTKEIQKDIDKVARDNGFHSRQAVEPQPEKRERFNGGVPKTQLNIKVPIELHARYYDMAKRRGNTALYELLAEALDALEAKEAEDKQ